MARFGGLFCVCTVFGVTIRSPEIENAILERLMGGEGLSEICRDKGMPDRTTVHRWLSSDPEFATRCARAREFQADVLFDELADIESRTLTGEIDPAAARAVLSSKQWRASKLFPKRYGDRQILSGDEDSPLEVTLSTRLLAARKRDKAGDE